MTWNKVRGVVFIAHAPFLVAVAAVQTESQPVLSFLLGALAGTYILLGIDRLTSD